MAQIANLSNYVEKFQQMWFLLQPQKQHKYLLLIQNGKIIISRLNSLPQITIIGFNNYLFYITFQLIVSSTKILHKIHTHSSVYISFINRHLHSGQESTPNKYLNIYIFIVNIIRPRLALYIVRLRCVEVRFFNLRRWSILTFIKT